MTTLAELPPTAYLISNTYSQPDLAQALQTVATMKTTGTDVDPTALKHLPSSGIAAHSSTACWPPQEALSPASPLTSPTPDLVPNRERPNARKTPSSSVTRQGALTIAPETKTPHVCVLELHSKYFASLATLLLLSPQIRRLQNNARRAL